MKIYSAFMLCFVSIYSFSQNTFPSYGNVGIGTSSPSGSLEVIGNGSSAFPLTIKNNTSNVLALYSSNYNGTYHAGIFNYRSRGTYQSPVDLSSGDRIGGFYALPYFGGGYRAAAAFEMYVGSGPSSSSYPTYLVFSTTPSGSTSRQERLRISENGFLGIGTSSPSELLHVNGNIRGPISGAIRISTGYGYVDVGPMNTSWSHFQTDRSRYYFNVPITVDGGLVGSYDEDLALQTSGTSRMTISNSTGNVGINTSPTSHRLDVNGTINATGLYVNGAPFTGGGGSSQWITSGSNIHYNTGAVGIGTTPSQALDVVGRTQIRSSSSSAGTWYADNSGSASAFFGLDGTSSSSSLGIYHGGQWRLLVSSTGNVGIGTSLTSNPNNYKLAVNGTIGSKEVKVETSSATWPDYVFKPDYKLNSIEQVDLFIKENGHLPGVPTAKDIEHNGQALGEMNTILLKKIEELTLYVIDLKKEIDQLKKDN